MPTWCRDFAGSRHPRPIPICNPRASPHPRASRRLSTPPSGLSPESAWLSTDIPCQVTKVSDNNCQWITCEYVHGMWITFSVPGSLWIISGLGLDDRGVISGWPGVAVAGVYAHYTSTRHRHFPTPQVPRLRLLRLFRRGVLLSFTRSRFGTPGGNSGGLLICNPWVFADAVLDNRAKTR